MDYHKSALFNKIMKEHNIQDRGHVAVNYQLPDLPKEKPVNSEAKKLPKYTPSGLTLSCPFEL